MLQCHHIACFCIIVRYVLCICIYLCTNRTTVKKRSTIGNQSLKKNQQRKTNIVNKTHHFTFLKIKCFGCYFFFRSLLMFGVPSVNEIKKCVLCKRQKQSRETYGIRPSIVLHEWRMHKHANLSIWIIKNKVVNFVVINRNVTNSILSLSVYVDVWTILLAMCVFDVFNFTRSNYNAIK